MNNALTSPEAVDFTKEIAKTFVVSAATTAGVWTGLMAVGYGVVTVKRRKERKSKSHLTVVK